MDKKTKYAEFNLKSEAGPLGAYWEQCLEAGVPCIWVEHWPWSIPQEQRPFLCDLHVNMTPCQKGLAGSQLEKIEVALNEACLQTKEVRAKLYGQFIGSAWRVYLHNVPRDQATELARKVVEIVGGQG